MIHFGNIKSFFSKNVISFGCLFVSLTSCNDLKNANSITSEQVMIVNPGKDTIFSLANQNLYDAADITIKGTLSDTSIVAVSTDSTFIGKATYYVSSPKIAFSQKMKLNGIKNDILYIKYHPIRNSNSGDVNIKVDFF